MNDPRQLDGLLASAGGIARIRHLTAAGISSQHIRVAVVDGRAERVRQGWIAGPTAPAETVRAVRVGGWLSCVSALRMHRVWCADDDRLHVRVDRHTNHLASPDDRSRPLDRGPSGGTVIHRSFSTDTVSAVLPTDSVETALLHAPSARRGTTPSCCSIRH